MRRSSAHAGFTLAGMLGVAPRYRNVTAPLGYDGLTKAGYSRVKQPLIAFIQSVNPSSLKPAAAPAATPQYTIQTLRTVNRRIGHCWRPRLSR
jgi:hypothetical protein